MMTNKATAFGQKLDVFFRARFTLIVIQTIEEQRAIQILGHVCDQTNRAMVTWDVADHFQTGSGIELPALSSGGGLPAKDGLTALKFVAKFEPDDRTVFVFKDFHKFWDNPIIQRKLRNVAQVLKSSSVTLVIITPSGKIPDELKNDVVITDLPLPDASDLDDVLVNLSQTPGVNVNLTDEGRAKLVRAATGMTVAQGQRAFSRAVIQSGSIGDDDLETVLNEKRQIIAESQALEYYHTDQVKVAVGGYSVLKNWLSLRERALSDEARAYGLPAPKGVSLIGIPGTGKSLAAKMIASNWGMPLLRLDVGSLFGSLVGQSEEQTRQALNLAEAVSPCVLWIDEIEKGLGGMNGSLDGGTSTRVFGQILTWMQEKTAPVFVVATANDITKLPPELMRKGRFDEIFFLDLPNFDERAEIFSVHISQRDRDVNGYNLEKLAAASEGYVGAEIEQAVIDAMYIGFADGREFTTEDIVDALTKQIPLAQSQKEKIDFLRTWISEGRAVSASASMEVEAGQGNGHSEQVVKLEL